MTIRQAMIKGLPILAHNRVAAVMDPTISTPPMVGVPALAPWSSASLCTSSAVLMGWPIFREISARMTRGANIMVRAKETRQARRALPVGSANAPEGLNCSITECIKFTVAER